jgi:hypothetical protein
MRYLCNYKNLSLKINLIELKRHKFWGFGFFQILFLGGLLIKILYQNIDLIFISLFHKRCVLIISVL